MSRQRNRLFPGHASLSVLVVCLAVTAACGGTSDVNDEASAGSSSAGSSPSTAAGGKAPVASGGSVASGGQVVGSGGSGNSAGAGGFFQFAGASSQAAGTGGAFVTGGSTGSSGGAKSDAGGAAFSGGGRSGMGGAAGHAGQSSGGSGGAAPTWTEIYTKFLTNTQYASNCNGSSCHNPGVQKGYDFSTQAKGYASVKSKTSQLVSELSSGGMPKGKPKMPAADLAVIKAWVAAGAQNN